MAASITTSFGILALSVVLALSGCAARAKTPVASTAAAKPAAPAPPPAPVALSTPQTQVELPIPQPIDPAALLTEPQPSPPPDPPVASRPSPPRRAAAPRPETTPPPNAAPAEPPRQPFQEIVSPADTKRFQDSAQSRKREVARILDALKSRRLNKAQQNVVANIRSFVELSDESEKRNEMRMADVLAEKAQILARNLENGK